MSHQPDLREIQIRRITLWGSFVNIVLSALKIVVGVLIHSSALIVDGVHSLSDLATDVLVLVGVKLAQRPPDRNHPYGHYKIETIFSQLLALLLTGLGIGFIYFSVRTIWLKKPVFPGPLMILIAGISLVAKEILYLRTKKVAKRTHSSALFANAWHHRSDAWSSLSVCIGGIASVLGWGYADQVATIVIGLMIIYVSGKIVYQGLIELIEHSVDEESLQAIEKVLDSETTIAGWHALRSRKSAGEIFLDVHIKVDPHLTVEESHEITQQIEEKIKNKLSRPVNILIHVDPDEKGTTSG